LRCSLHTIESLILSLFILFQPVMRLIVSLVFVVAFASSSATDLDDMDQFDFKQIKRSMELGAKTDAPNLIPTAMSSMYAQLDFVVRGPEPPSAEQIEQVRRNLAQRLGLERASLELSSAVAEEDSFKLVVHLMKLEAVDLEQIVEFLDWCVVDDFAASVSIDSAYEVSFRLMEPRACASKECSVSAFIALAEIDLARPRGSRVVRRGPKVVFHLDSGNEETSEEIGSLFASEPASVETWSDGVSRAVLDLLPVALLAMATVGSMLVVLIRLTRSSRACEDDLEPMSAMLGELERSLHAL